MRREKIMQSWKKERSQGKERYVTSRTILMGLGVMVGSMLGRISRGEPFFLDYFMFIAGAIGGAIGSPIAWKRGEDRYLRLLQEEEGMKRDGGPDGSL